MRDKCRESDHVLYHDSPVLISRYKTLVEHGFREMFSPQKIEFMLQLLMGNLAECGMLGSGGCNFGYLHSGFSCKTIAPTY
nr:hypothetical protein [Ruminobacter amylophilus]